MSLLGLDEVEERLKGLDSWTYKDKSLIKDFSFDDFASALGFVNKVGGFAEEAGHHPDILLYSWNKVRVTLSTHSEGGVTEKDFLLAERIDRLRG